MIINQVFTDLYDKYMRKQVAKYLKTKVDSGEFKKWTEVNGRDALVVDFVKSLTAENQKSLRYKCISKWIDENTQDTLSLFMDIYIEHKLLEAKNEKR